MFRKSLTCCMKLASEKEISHFSSILCFVLKKYMVLYFFLFQSFSIKHDVNHKERTHCGLYHKFVRWKYQMSFLFWLRRYLQSSFFRALKSSIFQEQNDINLTFTIVNKSTNNKRCTILFMSFSSQSKCSVLTENFKD